MMTDHRPPQTAVDIDAADLVAVIAQAWDGADGDIWQVDDPEGYANALAAAARWLEKHQPDPALVAACTAALYLLGSDDDRARIGPVPPWAPSLAPSIVQQLRDAIAASTPLYDPETLIV